MEKFKCDPEHLVALALAGVLPEEQTRKILSSVSWTSYRMDTLALENTLSKVSEKLRQERKD